MAVFLTEFGPGFWIFLPQQTLAYDYSLQTKWALFAMLNLDVLNGLVVFRYSKTWSLSFCLSISFKSVNSLPASSQTLFNSDRRCQLLWFILTYFRCFFSSSLLSHYSLRARDACQDQGWAGVESMKSVLSCEHVVRKASSSTGPSLVLGPSGHWCRHRTWSSNHRGSCRRAEIG